MKGAIYVALNQTADTMAARSCRSLKHHTPMPVTLFTDQATTEGCFDHVVRIPGVAEGFEGFPSYPDQGLIAKVKYLTSQAEYDPCLFLDIDTYVCADVEPLFQALDRFDLAVALDTGQHAHPGIPEAFPTFNTGVIAWKWNDRTRHLFHTWWRYYAECTHQMQSGWYDQPAFQKVVYESDVRVCTMRPEWNARFIFPTYVWGQVKVLHGRPDDCDLETVARGINQGIGDSRVWYACRRICKYQARIGFSMG
jgi:hypothetical protein